MDNLEHHPRFLQRRHTCTTCGQPAYRGQVLCDGCEDARVETTLAAIMAALKETEQ